VIASYRETTNVEGMVVARYFPLLETTIRTDGQLVVVDLQRGRQADLAGTRAGDVVLGVGSRAVVTVDGLARAAREAWSAAAPRGSVTIDLESAGAKRSVQLWKPAPSAP
jgi:C-terminal processing protease CtpA/Prc